MDGSDVREGLPGSATVQFDMKVVGEEATNDTQLVLHTDAVIHDTQVNLESLLLVDQSEFDPKHELLDEPIFGQTVAGPARAEEEEADHCLIEGVDPDGDEPAGVDEEWRNFKKGKKKGSNNMQDEFEPMQDVPEQVEVEPNVLPENFHDEDLERVPDDEVISIGPQHNCTSTSKVTGREASASWIAHRVKPMLIKKPGLGARELQERLEGQFNVILSYNKV